MAQKFYLDTSIWRDYFENRADSIRPLGEFAFQFLKKCKKNKEIIVVSDVVVKELRKDFSESKIEEMLFDFKGLIIEFECTKEQTKEALILLEKFRREFPLGDILHSIIARDENAILVTRDKHFLEIGLVEVFAPEDLF